MNVLITGCSRGIGKAMLNILLSMDEVEKVFAISSNTSQLQLNNKLVPIQANFLSKGWEQGVESAVGDYPISVLINNAGYLYNGSIQETSLFEIDKMLAINYKAPLQLVQSLFDNLKKGKAHIINIGSMGGYSGSAKFPGLSVYSSSKAAIACLSECWAEELKEFGIKSNCLALGAVNTEMLKEAFPGYQAPVSPELMAKRIIDFAFEFPCVINGKVIPFSVSTP